MHALRCTLETKAGRDGGVVAGASFRVPCVHLGCQLCRALIRAHRMSLGLTVTHAQFSHAFSAFEHGEMKHSVSHNGTLTARPQAHSPH